MPMLTRPSAKTGRAKAIAYRSPRNTKARSASEAAWKLNLDSSYQSDQFADNANTSAESADGSTGKIPGYIVFSSRAAYDFGP
ncbi:hypothetical protein PS723_02640 [Pseudomonas fluorescens]|uniref:Uncharacterized protein n=1 Tax=Pseudomonas fluorescens TaxID=294 RepID=A0A5E7C894_PSEFL|nr:hypothetical protein PS723_02640 [Pseudomonas fluorescens]